jgi:hypothetical protein
VSIAVVSAWCSARCRYRFLLLLLGGAAVVLSAAPSSAQTSAEVFAGASLLATSNGSTEFALPTDNHGVAAVVGFSVWSPERRWCVGVESELSRTLTREVPGAIKAGPVTYVISQQPRLGGVLLGLAVAQTPRVRLVTLIGASLVQNTPTVRYSFQEKPTLESEQTRLAWSGGVDVAVSRGRLVVRVPRLRVHYLTGVERALNGFGAPRVLWSAGATLGWRF